MGYKKGPAGHMKASTGNKAVGYMAEGSMAYMSALHQTDARGGEELKEFTGMGKQTSFKKDDIKKVIESQKQYDSNTRTTARNLAEIDSLKREASGRGESAKHFYGYNYTSDMPVPTGEKNRPFKNKKGILVSDSYRTSSVESRKKNLKKLQEEAKKMQGPRPTL